jgi:MFS family permease
LPDRAWSLSVVQPIYLITLNTLLIQGAHIGSRVVASLFALELGANPFTIGLLIGVYAVFPLILGVYSGRISDRYGSRRPMMAGILLLALGLALPVLWQTLPVLFGSAVLIGTGFVFFNVSNQTLAGALGTPEQRTRNFATLGLGYASGHLVGPVIAGYTIDHLGYVYGYLALASFTVAPLVMIAREKRLDVSTRKHTTQRGNTLALLKAPLLRRAIIVSGLITTGWDLFGFYVPIYGHSIGLSASTIGNILGAFAVATFIVRVLLPRLTRRFGIEPVLAAAALGAAVLFVPFPLVQSVPLLFLLAFGIGFALGCSQPLTLNLAYNYSPAGRSGEVTGLRLTINNITHIAVPVAAGGLATALGVGPVFWTSAVLLTLGGWLTRKRS